MKKNNLKFFSATFVIAVALLTACQQSQSPESAEGVKPVATNDSTIQATMKFAYVDVDSLSAHYQYCIDAAKDLENKVKLYQSTLTQKQTSLQRGEQALQKKVQDGSITNEEQYKAELEKLQQQALSAQQYELQQGQSLQNERDRILIALQDSLNKFLPEYNKNKHYTMILNRGAIMHAEGVTDITAEVVAGLNKRYNK